MAEKNQLDIDDLKAPLLAAVGAADLRWLLPIPWVAAGAAGLAATLPRMRGTST